MKHRKVWKVFLFTILTLGMYRLYWFIKTRKEMMTLNPDVKIMSPALFLLPVILVVASVAYLVIDMIGSAQKLPAYCQTINGTQPTECQVTGSPLPIILLYLVFMSVGPLVALWMWGYSKAVEKITNEQTSFVMSMVVLLLVPDGIDILIMQDAFNKVAPNHEGPAPPVAPSIATTA